MRVKLSRNLIFLVTFLNPIAVNLTNVISHSCKHGGTQAFYNANTSSAWTPPSICHYFRFLSNSYWTNFSSQCRRDYSRHRYIMDSTTTVKEGAMRNPSPWLETMTFEPCRCFLYPLNLNQNKKLIIIFLIILNKDATLLRLCKKYYLSVYILPDYVNPPPPQY